MTVPKRDVGPLLKMLAVAGATDCAPFVADLLESGVDPRTRRHATRALGAFGDLPSAEALLQVAGSEAERKLAQTMLARAKDPGILNTLADRSRKHTPGTRIVLLKAAGTLDAIGDKLVAFAIEGLSDPDPATRLASLKLLGKARKNAAIRPLVTYFGESRNDGERSLVLDALVAIGTRRSGEAGSGLAHQIQDPGARAGYESRFRRLRDLFH